MKRDRMRWWSVVAAMVGIASVVCAQDPPPEQVRLGTWVQSFEDQPDILLVHRHGHTTDVTRVEGTGEPGIPLQYRGPAEVSMKWMGSPEPWPPEITVLGETPMCDDILLVRVADTNALEAAAILNSMPQVLYAYPVEFTNPMFSRVMPTDQIIVRLAPGADIAEVEAEFGLLAIAPMIGSTVEYVMRMVDPKAMQPADVVAFLEADTNKVVWAQRDCLRDAEFYYTPGDPLYARQWHLNANSQAIGTYTAPNNVDVNAPEAWNISRGTNSVKIAVIDDAIETTHEDLAGNISATGEYDFFNNDTNADPDTGNDMHGTPCAGVAAAVEGNSLGGVGIAHWSEIVPVKICSNGVLPYDSSVAGSVRHAAQHADIITCSWGYVNPAPSTLSSVRYALQSGAGGKGSVVFFAAGNDGGFRIHAVTLSAAAPNYNVRWRYVKDATVSYGQDKCFLDSVWYPNGVTEFFDALVTPNLPATWTSGGSGAGWTSQAEYVGTRAESGTQFIGSPVITHSQSAYVQVPNLPVSSGWQTIWYYMDVDAQPTTYVLNTATFYDYGQVEYQAVGAPTWTTANVQGGAVAPLSYPAADPETVAVGANDVTARRSHYSQWGSALDFVAPSDGTWYGLGIETTDLSGPGAPPPPQGPGYDAGKYCKADTSTKFGGTSSATPLAAGIGALLRTHHAGLSPSQVRNLLRASCTKINSGWYTYTATQQGGRCNEVGWGMVNAQTALNQATLTPGVAVIANDLKITEVSPLDGDCPFVEIHNSNPGYVHQVGDLMLTDCETGGDMGESSYQFPMGAFIPPQGMVVVALGAATPAMVNELNMVMAGTGWAFPQLQLFECMPSGLTFGGQPVQQMLPLAPIAGFGLGGADNVALVVTPGMHASYLPDVVDGMSFGAPFVDSGCTIGVAPQMPELMACMAVATTTASYQRNGFMDTENSQNDFTVQTRTPGHIVYGLPAQQFDAEPLTSMENFLSWMPPNPGDMVVIAASPDPQINLPVHGTPYPQGVPLGAGNDMVIYAGPSPMLPTTHVDPGEPPGSYPPGAPVYYRLWVDYGMNYSAGLDVDTITLQPPVPLPVMDPFPPPVIDPNIWPYAPGATIDMTQPMAPSPPECALLDAASGGDQIASLSIDAAPTTNVQVRYWVQEGGNPPADPPEPGDDLWVEVLDPGRNWVQLAHHPATGGPTPFLPFTVQVPAYLLHNEFRVRFRTTGGLGGPPDLDSWFVDDVFIEEFPVLAGFAWDHVASPKSVGVPFPVVLTAESSMGGTFLDYAGAAGLQLVVAGNPGEVVPFSPTGAMPFVQGVWTNNSMLVSQEPSAPVYLVANTNGVWGTSDVFQVLIDADLDGMDDKWEFDLWGDLGVASDAPDSDQDGDLFRDYFEFVAGTGATNSNSFLRLAPFHVYAGSNVLEWGSVSGRWYAVERSVDLVAGFTEVIASNLAANPPTNQYTDATPPTNAPVHYRLQVSKP